MDTILASIRRILNEDEVAPVEVAPAQVAPVQVAHEKRETEKSGGVPTGGRDDVPSVGPEVAPQDDHETDDVLVLGEAMMVPPEKPEKIEPALAMPPPTPPAASAPPDAAPLVALRDQSAEGLVAARTRAATAQSFDALHEAMRQERLPPPSATSPNLLRAGGPTLEDLVREELRGLISNWLDVHLPTLVETLVRLEIEKLTRRSG